MHGIVCLMRRIGVARDDGGVLGADFGWLGDLMEKLVFFEFRGETIYNIQWQLFIIIQYIDTLIFCSVCKN